MSVIPETPERGAEQSSEGLPIPKLESPSPVSSPSSVVDIDAIADKVAEKIQRDLRMAQSKKDKNAELVKKTYGIETLSELEGMGVQIPDNVKWEYRLRNVEETRSRPEVSEQAPSPGSGAALTAQDVSLVITDLQLDANDPQVIEALRGTYRNRDHFDATMTRLSLARATKQPPSASAAPAGNVPVPVSAPDEDQIYAEIAELSKNYTLNKPKIDALQKRLGK